MSKYISVKDAVVKLLSDDSSTVSQILSKVDPAQRDEVVSKLAEVREHLEKKHIGFDKLKGKLEGEGKTADSAGAIAASIGRKKYGKSEFQHAAATGHKMAKDDPAAGSDPNAGNSTASMGSGGATDPRVAQSLSNAFKSEETAKAERKGAVKDTGFFTTEHLHEVLKKPHHEARAYAHSLVDASNAHDHNKAKAKVMIDRSKNPRHLAQGMANFMMAHPSEGLGMGSGK